MRGCSFFFHLATFACFFLLGNLRAIEGMFLLTGHYTRSFGEVDTSSLVSFFFSTQISSCLFFFFFVLLFSISHRVCVWGDEVYVHSDSFYACMPACITEDVLCMQDLRAHPGAPVYVQPKLLEEPPSFSLLLLTCPLHKAAATP